MKKVSLKKIVGILCLLLVVIIGTTGCGTSNHNVQEIVSSQDTASREEILPDQDGNPYSTHKIINGETIVEYDYSEAYDKLDLDEYTGHGEFGEDGIMWVKKSDYTGIQYGYIDYNGKVIMPLTTGIEETTNFKDGFAIVKHKKDYIGIPGFSVIDKVGNILFDYYTTADIWENIIIVNKNIILARNIWDSRELENNKMSSLIFFSNTNKLVKINELFLCSFEDAPISVSDGLIRVVTYDAKKGYLGHRPNTIEYFDENGEALLKIDNNSNENYEHIQYVENFIDSKAVLTFEGKDENLYTVTIDKQGEWLDEPKMIQKSSAKSFQW